ncbi:ATP-binding protein [Rhizobium leguminosarum]|uniref:ATP-binding protein n=1 Tax=Rhizobium leguminosarum TaxID=384 RepID=UPI003CFFF3A2
MNDHEFLEASIAHARASMDPDELVLHDRVAKFRARYIGLARDEELVNALTAMKASIASHFHYGSTVPDKRRIVAVTGLSGAGKSRALEEHMRRMSFDAYVDGDKVGARPLLVFDAPSPCTPRSLALEGLRALGVPVKPSRKENEAWADFRMALKSHRVHYVHIDEAQHTIETANAIERAKIADALKQLVQMPDWPVRLILSGVPPLAYFLSNSQLANRRTSVPFEGLVGPAGLETVKEVVRKVIEVHAELVAGDDFPDDFPERALHAASGQLGSLVQLVRGACERVIFDRRSVVIYEDLAAFYGEWSGCRPHENVFTSVDWVNLKPEEALMREEDFAWREAKEAGKTKNKEKKLKFGQRP